MAQVTVLIWLNDLPDKSAALKELERELHVAQSTTADIVARLEQKGFVEGFGDSSDKRIKMVRITPKGEQCCINARKNMEESEGKLLSELSDEERITFNKLLQTVRNGVIILEDKKSLDMFSSMSVSKAVIKNAVPAMAAMLMVLIYNLADTFFVGQTSVISRCFGFSWTTFLY